MISEKTQLYILLILFWTPILISLIKNFFLNLRYWNINNFKFEYFVNYIKWNYQNVEKSHFKTILKYCLFSIIVFVFYSFPNYIIIPILLVYILYSYEFFIAVREFFSKENILAQKSYRNNLITFIFLLLIFAVATTLSNLYFEINSYLNSNKLTTSLIEDAKKYEYLIPENQQDINILYDIYLFLFFATTLSIFIDFSIPIILLILILITSPINYLITYLYSKTNKKLTIENLSILISEPFGQTGLSEYIIRSFHYNNVPYMHFYFNGENIFELIENIRQNYNPNKSFILHSSANTFWELHLLKNLFSFDFILSTSYISNHKNKTLKALEKLLENKGILIHSSKTNKNIKEIFAKSKKEIIGVYFKKSKKDKNIRLQEFKINNDDHFIDLTKLEYKGNIVKGKINDSNEISFYKYKVMTEILFEYLRKDFFLEFNKIDQQFKIPIWGTAKGDLNSTIYYSIQKRTSMLKVLSLINKIYNKQKKFILITNGFDLKLNKKTLEIYNKFISKLENKIDVLITNDPILGNITKKNTGLIETYILDKIDKVVFLLRQKMSNGCIVIIENLFTKELIDKLYGID